MSTQDPTDQITDDMVACWRVSYGLDTMTPADAMRWWESSCNGSAPAGAVAALGLCLAERDSLLRDWVAEQGERTAAVDRAERAELERDRLRADVAELLSCLEIIKQRTTHTTYRIGHDVHRMAEGLLAKHQKGASNGK